MDKENLENETPENNEEEISDDELIDETNDELAKAKEIANNQKIRAEKAEKELKALKAKSDSETSKKEEQPDNTDYGKLAFLNSKGVEHPDDQKIVMDEAKRLNLPIEKVLSEKYIQAQLKDTKDQREAENGMPEGGSGKSGGNKGSVDYWINRKDEDGNFITPEDTELANKVIDARIKAQEKNSMFSDELHN